jgi:energy-coupling factor transporter transmembrane protein EcfT
MRDRIPSFLLRRTASSFPEKRSGHLGTAFLDRGMNGLARFIRTSYVQWEFSRTDGMFQRLDARVKLSFLLLFAVIISLKTTLPAELAIALFFLVLAVGSRLPLLHFYRRVLLLGFAFGLLLGLPSAFNVVVPGHVVMPIVTLRQPHQFYVYHIPQTIGVTREGMLLVSMLTLRVINSCAASFLVLYTTPFSEVIRALKILRAPDLILMIIALFYKYTFVFADTVEEMYLAKKSRMPVAITNKEARVWVAGRMALLFRRTQLKCEEVFKAMLARGFTGEVTMCGKKSLLGLDWAAGVCLLAVGLLFLWM